MEVITIETKAFNELMEQIKSINRYIRMQSGNTGDDDVEQCFDNYEMCTYLKISSRSLQRLRSEGIIPYIISRKKAYYKLSDIKKMMEKNYIKCNEEHLKDLILNHNRYVEQRRDNKPNQ